MTELEIWLAILGIAATTLLTRGMPLLLPARWALPAGLSSALRYAPMAGLTAILVPDVVLSNGGLALDVSNLKLWAVAVAFLVWFRWQSTLMVLLVSGGVYLLLHLFAV
ncbi:MAG: hypothetical protein RLZZ344_53 [Pseudomonadota bacterium]|jgi:branched-subunit amino acid transport protein